MKAQEHYHHVELTFMTGGTGEDEHECAVDAIEQLKDILREIEGRYNVSVERYETVSVNDVDV